MVFSLWHFIATALDLMPCLQALGTRDCNKGIKFRRAQYTFVSRVGVVVVAACWLVLSLMMLHCYQLI